MSGIGGCGGLGVVSVIWGGFISSGRVGGASGPSVRLSVCPSVRPYACTCWTLPVPALCTL